MTLAENLELEERVRGGDHPFEIEAYRVYGDWFAQHGDPRGELVAIQAKLVEQPASAGLRKRETELLAEHRAAWLGTIATPVIWSYGFVEWAYATTGDTIDQLATLPCIGMLRRLTLHARESFAPMLTALEHHADRFRGISTLHLGTELRWAIRTPTSDVGSVWPGRALANLRMLEIRADYANLPLIDAPNLRTLVIEATRIDAEDFAAFAVPRWSNLERLEFTIGEDGLTASAASPAAFAPILAATHLPKLAHLAIAEANFVDSLIDALITSRVLPQLATLDLRGGALSQAGVATILRERAAFAHLEEFDLSATLPEAAKAEIAQLRALPNVVIDGWREDYDNEWAGG